VRAAAGATYVGNFVLLAPPRSLQGRTIVLLESDHSRAETRSIVLGAGGAIIDVDTEVHLTRAGTSAEAVAQAIARDRSDIALRAQIVGHHDESLGLSGAAAVTTRAHHRHGHQIQRRRDVLVSPVRP
jgi:hypothetical protein